MGIFIYKYILFSQILLENSCSIIIVLQTWFPTSNVGIPWAYLRRRTLRNALAVQWLRYNCKGTVLVPGQELRSCKPHNQRSQRKRRKKCRFLRYTPNLLDQTLGWNPEVVFQQDFQVTLMHTKDWKTQSRAFLLAGPG